MPSVQYYHSSMVEQQGDGAMNTMMMTGAHDTDTLESSAQDLETLVRDLFGKTLAMERDSLFVGRESVMGYRGLKKFRGVTKHKRTQRYEAHIWESKKQIYLGGFESELLAARSHDIMALKCKGPLCDALNFDRHDYNGVVPLLDRFDKDDIISCLRNYSKTCGGGGGGGGSLHASRGPHHVKLSVTKTLKLKRRTIHTNSNTTAGYDVMSLALPQEVKGHVHPANTSVDVAMAPITPQCATGKESMLLFDPVQPVDDLCSQGVFLPEGKNCAGPPRAADDQSPFASYGPLDDSFILDSFSSDASHGIDFGDMYEPGSGTADLALTTSVALHDDDALVSWLD